ncbi:MAG: amidohydrolase family protein [Aureliella sp.]
MILPSGKRLQKRKFELWKRSKRQPVYQSSPNVHTHFGLWDTPAHQHWLRFLLTVCSSRHASTSKLLASQRFLTAAITLLLAPVLVAQDQSATETPAQSQTTSPVADAALPLAKFFPVPQLRGKQTLLKRAKFPVVDAHSHFFIRLRHDPAQLEGFVELMDRNNIAVSVSIDGRLGDRLEEHIDYLWSKHKKRFVIYANVNWIGQGRRDQPETWDCHRPNFVRNTCEQLRAAAAKGISGVKVFKMFGLMYRNPDGSLIEIDDPRFDPIWETCGQLGLPVIMHTADPSAFFEPISPANERYEELSRHPDWHFPSSDFPSRKHLHAARNRLFSRHRNTQFIAAHLGNDGEDLEETAQFLQDNPNVVVEIASRISELGRQPYSARDFLIRFQDRVLFGTDGPWPEKRYHLYWRFLETKDEYFPYSEKPFPPQGFWRIYGVFLPDTVLRKIYSGNASRIIPGVAERLEAFKEQNQSR